MAILFVSRASQLSGLIALLLGCHPTSDSRGTPGFAHSDPGRASSNSLETPPPIRDDVHRQFTSYEEALRVVRSTYDCDAEEVNRSSVVFGAEYCDAGHGQGYLIVNLRGREYIHAGVPEEVWEEFRDAESMGSYYASNLRGHYRLTLAH